jgi:hypothetical protein
MAGTHRPGVTAIPLGRPSPGASSNQPERQGQRMKAPRRFKSAARRSYSVLLPAGLAMPPTLPPARCALTAPFHPCRDASGLAASDPAVCFLWRFPWGFPRRTLSGAAFRMEPGLSSASESGGRPADWLITAYGTEARAVKDNRKRKGTAGAPPRFGGCGRIPRPFIEASPDLWDCAAERTADGRRNAVQEPQAARRTGDLIA